MIFALTEWLLLSQCHLILHTYGSSYAAEVSCLPSSSPSPPSLGVPPPPRPSRESVVYQRSLLSQPQPPVLRPHVLQEGHPEDLQTLRLRGGHNGQETSRRQGVGAGDVSSPFGVGGPEAVLLVERGGERELTRSS
jgi:hypothetical protein